MKKSELLKSREKNFSETSKTVEVGVFRLFQTFLGFSQS
jgi:hypothetical protein